MGSEGKGSKQHIVSRALLRSRMEHEEKGRDMHVISCFSCRHWLAR